MRSPFSRAFTLIELIVVMAIIVTLSVVGFISYNSYVLDSRNAAREAVVNDITKAIDQYIFRRGLAPRCNTGSVCYFVRHSNGVNTLKYGTTGTNAPGNQTGPGITDADWDALGLKSTPLDPRGVYLVYAYNGAKYAVFATKELTNGFSTIIKGSGSFEGSGVTNVVQTVLGLPTPIDGHKVVDGAISSTPAGYPANPQAILYTNYASSPTQTGTSSIPYYW